jgi:hypothetical protein
MSYVIVVGRLAFGFKLIGPFRTKEEAAAHAKELLPKWKSWDVLQMKEPKC